MTVRRMEIVLGLLALAVPALVAAQGLGDAAARERARRDKQQATKTPVLTNEDLDKGRPPDADRAGEQRPAASEESRSEAPTSPPMEDRLANERPYLDALQAARTRVAEIEKRIQDMRAKLNPMSGSFIYGATGSNSANEEAEVREQLNQAEAELNAARQAAVEANQALEDFKRGRPSAPPLVQ